MHEKVFSIGGSGLLALSGALLTGGLVLFITPQTYESVAHVALEQDVTGVRQASAAASGWTEAELARWQSSEVLHAVVTNLDLSLKWGEKYKLGALPLDMIEKMLRSQLSVKRARESVVEVRAQSEDPMEAAAIANALVEAYRLALAPDSPIRVLERAEPNLRPVRPHPLLKKMVPLAGLLTGLLGVLMLLFGVFRAEKGGR